jgi:hypothetical protein
MKHDEGDCLTRQQAALLGGDQLALAVLTKLAGPHSHAWSPISNTSVSLHVAFAGGTWSTLKTQQSSHVA